MYAVKSPINSNGHLHYQISNAYYSIRDTITQKTIIPFDTIKGSTKLSSDNESLYFILDASSLTKERTYVIDVLLYVGGNQHTFLNVSPVFKISDL